MHYMFQSFGQADHFFEQISTHLKPGGVFIATTMDCRVLAEALAEQLHGCFDESQQHCNADNSLEGNINYAGVAEPSVVKPSVVGEPSTAAEVSANGVDLFAHIKALHKQHQNVKQDQVLSYLNDVGGELLHVRFTESNVTRLLKRNDLHSVDTAGSESPYGIQYTFTLHDSLEDAAVNAPEWVVPLGETLQALAARHGMRLLETQNFQDILSEMLKNESKLTRMESQHVFNHKGTLSDAEWRIARLVLQYRIFEMILLNSFSSHIQTY